MKRCLALALALLAVALLAPSASASLVGFKSKDGRVGCYMDGKGARCDAKKPTWQAPPTPPDCELDYGQGVAVSRHGAADYVCAGDTTLDPRHEVLGVGERVKRGRFKCKALDAKTIKCVNTRNGEGFAISRFAVELF